MDRRLPGIGSARTAAFRNVLWGTEGKILKPQGVIVDGSKSRDSGNTGDLATLRCGLLMGRIAASGKYAPSILGVLAADAAGSATSVTVAAAQAAEIVRRVGATGTLRFVGPPTAGGTVATFTETYSAVNTSTGAITCSALDAALKAGSLVCADDGTYLPRIIQGKEDGLKVTDQDGVDFDTYLADAIIGGLVDFSQLIEASSEASVQAWIKAQLRAYGLAYSFDDDF